MSVSVISHRITMTFLALKQIRVLEGRKEQFLVLAAGDDCK